MKHLIRGYARSPWLRSAFGTVACILLRSVPALAQAGTSPWENAVNVLQTAFTSTIARGLSLVAIVVAGLTFAFERSKRTSPIRLMSSSMSNAALAAAIFPRFYSSIATTRMPTCSITARCIWPSRIAMNSDSGFAPRSLSASEYVRELFGPADNVAILVRNRSTGHTVQTIAKAETVIDADFQRWLSQESATGYDVYIGMNPIKDGANKRTKESIEAVRHVYLDLDKNGDATLQAIRNSPEVPAPNFVLNTSPGKHQVIWKVSGLSQDEAETLLHSLANRFGGDLAATDSTRVLRLPGFANHKLAEEFIVQAHHESNAIYALRDFTIDEDSPEAQRHIGDSQAPQRKLPSSHRSQSERDWSYAKRALARGDDPEVIIQRIADYRADDKSDPHYYARRTVTKAAIALRSGKANRAHSVSSANENNREPAH